ncbi:MAG: saccharopine dehydrogenase NADP-binding domain-containing protein [Solirubrobacterales bacterium]|nr:saccharopine dehydrogenase NADP-binding domain-containing protein [Solirubrobacterales bacterium]
MPAPVADRGYELALFGATGFTGELTADYLARHVPAGTRWALAGRNRGKLDQVRRRLAEIDPAAGEPALLHADVEDPDSLRALAESAGVVISTVGPYIVHGEPLVAACAAAGTTYLDLTGEPEFVDRMWLGYQEQALATGARLVHSCGFDSIPYDLGALFTVLALPEGVPIALQGYVRVGGTISGGTYQSAIHIFARLRQAAAAAAERRRREGRPEGRTVRGVMGTPHRDGDAGGWAVPVPTIDPVTVLRSARALDRYGPEFSYSHYLVVKRLPALAAMAGGVGGALALAQLPPTRSLLLRLKGSGEGPSPEQRQRSWFRVRFVGEGGGKRVVTEVRGGDPGYDETAKMLAESALCLARDPLPELAGQLTPAVAMGEALIGRLQRAGIEFRVVE